MASPDFGKVYKKPGQGSGKFLPKQKGGLNNLPTNFPKSQFDRYANDGDDK